MIVSLHFENFTTELSQEEVIIIDTIISQIDYVKLLTLLSNKFSRSELNNLLKKMIKKNIVSVDDNSFIKDEEFTKKETNNIIVEKTISRKRIESIELPRIIEFKQLSNKKFDKKLSDEKIVIKTEKLYNYIKEKRNYYEILGLTLNSTIKEIKIAYFSLSKEFHPDMYKKDNLSEDIKKKMFYISVELTNIYNTLKVKSNRVKYLQTLDIFQNRKKSIVSKTDQESLEKAKDFYNMASDELNQNNVEKALKLINMSLVYQAKDKQYIKFKNNLEEKLKKDDLKKVYLKLEKLLSNKEYDLVLIIVKESLRDFGILPDLLVYKVRALLGPNLKIASDIINILEQIIELDPSIKNYEFFIESLKKLKLNNKIKEIAKKLLEIDPKNKLAKSCTKRSKWSIF